MKRRQNELALYIEASAYWHTIQLTADPATATAAVGCSCGWRSREMKFAPKIDIVVMAKSLAPDVYEHLSEAIKQHDEKMLELNKAP